MSVKRNEGGAKGESGGEKRAILGEGEEEEAALGPEDC